MADPAIVAKFADAGGLPEGAVPVASLAMLWYLTKFDGEQRVSVSVGDVVSLIHQWLHADDEAQT